MKWLHRVLGLVVVLGLHNGVHAQEALVSGEYSIAARFTIDSKILGEKREVLISVPQGYEESRDTFPVHILLDGEQNIEHAVASTRLQSQWSGLPKSIIVAIPSVDRTRDFTPSQDINYSPQSGGAEAFAEFIEHEVMAFVDKHYRTHPYRVLMGHSLSGLFAASQLLAKNPSFQAYIIVAPSMWWHNQAMLNQLSKMDERELPTSTPVYIGIGELDGMVPMAQQFYDGLARSEASSSLIGFKVYNGEGHMSAPMTVFYDGLKHVFAEAVYDNAKWGKFTSESFLEFVAATKERFGSTVKQTGEQYHALASYLVEQGNYEGAITVLTVNVKHYPNYPFNHRDLATVYALNDQNELAIAEFERAAQLARSEGATGSGDAEQYEREAERLRQPIAIERAKLLIFDGCYQSESGAAFQFNLVGNNLIGQRQGWADFRLFPEGNDKFYTRSLGLAPSYQFKESGVDVLAYGQAYPYAKVACE